LSSQKGFSQEQINKLSEYIHNFEHQYTSVLSHGLIKEQATELAHLAMKAASKIWYRMNTNFEKIEKIHKERVEYIQALGEHLYNIPNIKNSVDLMLMIKDLATGTDGCKSDMDLAFCLNDNIIGINLASDFDRNSVAVRFLDNNIAPSITEFMANPKRKYPTNTSQIDYKNQAYSTTWLRTVSKEKDHDPLILFNGKETIVHARKYVSQNLFGYNRCGVLSIPVQKISKEGIFEELMGLFNPEEAKEDKPTLNTQTVLNLNLQGV
jgi:hypothetical protein